MRNQNFDKKRIQTNWRHLKRNMLSLEFRGKCDIERTYSVRYSNGVILFVENSDAKALFNE